MRKKIKFRNDSGLSCSFQIISKSLGLAIKKREIFVESGQTGFIKLEVKRADSNSKHLVYVARQGKHWKTIEINVSIV